MPRKSLGLTCLLLAALALGGAPLARARQAEKKPATLKILVPDDTDNYQNTAVTVNDKEVKDTGTERKFETPPLEPGKDHAFTVKAVIKPNNYTTITRTRKVTTQAGKALDVDLRKESKDNRDEIVVRYVPTPEEVVDAMIKLGGMTKDDVVYDLGCGDGRMVIRAVQQGAKRGVGIDIDPQRIKECKENAKKAGVEGKVEFREGDVLKVKDISDASLILLYMGRDLNMALEPILKKQLKPGTRVVSHRFLMSDDWPPAVTQKITAKDNHGEEDDFEIHLWRIGKEEKKPGPGGPQAPAERKPVNLKVLLPDERVKLTIDGTATRATGTERSFVSPPLEPGVNYTYTLVMVWQPNNYTTITRTKAVPVKSGQDLVVDLRQEDKESPDKVVVRYVPTPQEVVEEMCKLGGVKEGDVVYDLGCGDGRFVITAVKKYGAKRGVGVDIDPERITDSNANAKKEKVEDKVEFRQEDVLKIKDISDATVVMLYMGEELNQRLRPILQKTLKPGTRVVSHRFTMGDWKPEKTVTVTDGRGQTYKLHLWRIGEEK